MTSTSTSPHSIETSPTETNETTTENSLASTSHDNPTESPLTSTTPDNTTETLPPSLELHPDPPLDEDCPICYTSFATKDDSVIRTKDCNHTFHKSCLLIWLEEEGTCPYCRGDLTPNYAVYDGEERLDDLPYFYGSGDAVPDNDLPVGAHCTRGERRWTEPSKLNIACNTLFNELLFVQLNQLELEMSWITSSLGQPRGIWNNPMMIVKAIKTFTLSP
ncbi:hypothetical protein CC80DRAFT_505809 [Byssothecium circinans]|uniref:RING-type domain-containing protein n=1 Tax=Byssothecium circinans TaxID=147558 RepID=A0A6A5TSK6_9PLEO|nr:hypothetical protein CC80DRAFT_505809 [Byssothecium circinans]